ncbi:MAG: tRNA (adenosine(37)-N6)-threonylcarbamoyltransferase complex transferase subunit TsaD [Candidatus Saccharimonas sp.]
MKILGIESSCDETAASVVENGRLVLSHVVVSQIDIHKHYGGVVPEIAARSHIEVINPVVQEALERAGCSWDDIDAIAVTYAPGLVGSLLVGTLAARTLAILHDKPLYPIHHVEAHVYANFVVEQDLGRGTSRTGKGESRESLERELDSTPSKTASRRESYDSRVADVSSRVEPSSPLVYEGSRYETFEVARGEAGAISEGTSATRVSAAAYATETRSEAVPDGIEATSLPTFRLPTHQPAFPMLALIVSGGHSQLVLFRDHGDYELLGQTQDDAVGEAFDKVAKILGLPYPGGPSIAEAAKKGDAKRYKLPKARMPGRYDFSFSGLKTAVLRAVQHEVGKDFTFPSHELPGLVDDEMRHNFAASFQRVAVETLVDKAIAAYREFGPASVVIAGGVAANLELRRQLADRLPIPIEYAPIQFCTDNATMVATLGYYRAQKLEPADPYTVEVVPSLSMTKSKWAITK